MLITINKDDKVVFISEVEDFGAFCPVTVPKNSIGKVKEVTEWNGVIWYKIVVNLFIIDKYIDWIVDVPRKYIALI